MIRLTIDIKEEAITRWGMVYVGVNPETVLPIVHHQLSLPGFEWTTAGPGDTVFRIDASRIGEGLGGDKRSTRLRGAHKKASAAVGKSRTKTKAKAAK